MVDYARSLTAEGKEVEAVECLIPVLKLGHTLQANPRLIYTLIGMAFQGMGCEGVTTCLHPGSKLTVEQWQSLGNAAQAALPPPELYMQSLENECLFGDEFFRNPAEAARNLKPFEPTEGIDAAGMWPGWWSREGRIYRNQMGELLAAAQNHGQPPEKVAPPSFRGLLTGEFGIFAYELVPAVKKFEAQLQLVRRRLESVVGFCAINAYLTRHGKLPASTDHLKEIGLALSDQVVWVPETRRLVAKVPPEVWERTNYLEYHKVLKGDCCQTIQEGFVYQF